MSSYAYGQLSRAGNLFSPIEFYIPNSVTTMHQMSGRNGFPIVSDHPQALWAYAWNGLPAMPPWGQLWPTTR
jgi:hypothetical protein